ncbi:MAG TPA: DinB family protein [Vicinamibacterales bacterium]|nr:DinB family protein [Vicinamibacterales bacterium]
MASAEIAQLLRILDQAYDRRSWHGTNLRGSIRGLTPEQAAWRPAPGAHNVWEIVVHAAYWKYAVRRRLSHGARGSFPLKGSNWFDRSADASPDAWHDDVALLARMHRELRASVERVPAAALRGAAPGGQVSVFDLIAGIASHDLYHAGQIQLVKRLMKDRRRSRGSKPQ